MSLSFRYLLFGIALLSPVLAAAQPDEPSTAAEAPLFASDDVLDLTLEGDLRPIFRDRRDEPDDRPATLSYVGPDGAPVALDIEVQTRGNFRLHRLRCNVPPLRLDVHKAALEGTVFAGQRRLKLVTHCRDRSERYEEQTLREYLVYRLYNELTDLSFRVRLVRLTYVDTERDLTLTRFGFLIEDDDDMAARNGGRILNGAPVHPEATDREAITRLALFQFMIGNTDWGVSTSHNTDLVFLDPVGPIVAVPYDFDWAGFVDAPYAEPHPRFDIQSVRERRYQGFCRTPEEFDAALAPFTARREALLDLVRDFPHLPEKRRADAADYLEGFYDVVDDPGRFGREILGHCLTEH